MEEESHDYDYNNSSYDYDYNDTSDCDFPSLDDMQMIKTVNLVLGGYVTMLVAVLGVLANILAIAVFCRKTLQNNFNHLLIALAAFDLLFLIVSVTESVRKNFEDREADSSSSLGGLMTKVNMLLVLLLSYLL